MFGSILVGIIGIVVYVAGVPLIPLLLFVIAGTYIEYRWINKKHDG